ncbi:MAG TPA: sterol desaturase family protein [Drouetiella sp.]|jgi:sterol desaturase/sphingolipid hydroxylase (fatty acid hydroxylase superfamily)
MNLWMLCALMPMLTFVILVLAERRASSRVPSTLAPAAGYSRADWFLNLSGFFMQGLVVPLAGLALALFVFPVVAPSLHQSLHIGFAGAFLLNFVVVDFFYYLQHRAFHQIPMLWKLHAPHHFSPTVDVWATSRNALMTHFLFVYMLLSPILAYLCDVTEGFFAGAMLTASLDLFRHARINVRVPVLDAILIMPADHHRHHDADKPEANYGANLNVWDKLFGTFEISERFPSVYAGSHQPSFQSQLLFPWRST